VRGDDLLALLALALIAAGITADCRGRLR